MDYERLDFGAKVPQFICDIFYGKKITKKEMREKLKKKNHVRGEQLMVFIPHTVSVRRFPVEVALMVFCSRIP